MRRAGLLCAAGAAALGLTLAACAADGSSPASPARISVSGAYVPLSATPDMAVAYFDIANTGGSADRLTGVTSPDAQSAELDQSTATSMTAITGGVAVPAHGSTAFARDGRHVMLMGLSPAPRLGGHVELRLTFQHSGTITVEATVQPLTYQPAS
ncbi:copper chaperone PCu(A)C [Streptacidiphilus sp. PB12-B1b]|uniref:copper chaperone PCu(A)C n=1 Tax=Streptacidiphilus sp. PB12-B1b TaxID=2705012 RepID=UPI0015FE67F7|nr:copper chaperone PCu(A)C [Streptacidiphilus sp. PB12-B1b]QMU74504.1 copper chaperone PCu(A)C [Streptacidiphilus sp. PB12-B1b]